MTIAVIQDRPIICNNGGFYSLNPVDIEKYLRLCDNLIYCASPSTVDEAKLQRATQLNPKRVSVRLVNKSPLKEMLCPSKQNREAVRKAIEEADVIVIKTPSITIGKLAYDMVKKSNKRYIVEVIGCAWDSYWYHDIKGKLIAFYSVLVCRKMCANSKNVLYVTNKFLQRRYPNKFHNIGCSNVVINTPQDSQLKERLMRIENTPINVELKIGTAGAIDVRYKGQQYVIEALGILKKQGRIFHYFLAGGGSQDYLLSIAKKYDVENQVHFLGMVPKSKMMDFYDSLDIYIHPSMAEGLPRVMIEAESRAIPSLGANASGTPELLDEDCIFKIQSAKDICRILSSFDKEKMKRVAKNNFERSKQYAIDVLSERRKKFYSELL